VITPPKMPPPAFIGHYAIDDSLLLPAGLLYLVTPDISQLPAGQPLATIGFRHIELAFRLSPLLSA